MKIGIVGLPNVGKSTLFKALTKKSVDISNYPFCTIEPNVGVCEVPDGRLKKLAEFSQSQKIIPACVEFVDIAGLVKGAAKGEGLGNKFLSHIREVDAILHVVRIFEDKFIKHVDDVIDPLSDVEVVIDELILKDLETVEGAMKKVEQSVKSHDQDAVERFEVLQRVKKLLEQEKLLSKELSIEEREIIKEFNLLTVKPFLYCFNIGEGQVSSIDELSKDFFNKIAPSGNYVVLSVKIEQELSELSKEEQAQYRSDLGLLHESGVDQLIQKSYEVLDQISFLTTGEKETRAWTIRCGWNAKKASGRIHTDFEKKFIKAEIIPWNVLLQFSSWHDAKEHGKVRLEGKEYIMQDGDVVVFKVGG